MSDFNNNNRNNGAIGYFKKLAEKANKTANSEVAKDIRNKLLRYGIIGVVVSGLLILTGFIGFAATGMNAANSMSFGFPSGILVFMVLFLLGGVGVSISSLAIKAGLSIVAAGFTTDLLDNNEYCPNCKDRVDNDEMFCNKCGYNLRANKLCSCGTQNDINDKFCKNCGKNL